MIRRDERGTALIEFVWLAILMLIPLVYIVLAVFETQRTSYAASAAARSAGRAFVTAPDEASARARANAAARLAFKDQGLTAAPMQLRIVCRPSPEDCLSPGSVVLVQVDSSAALPLMPDVFGGDAPRILVSADHQAPYGTFRERR